MRKATTLRCCVFAVAVATALLQLIWICDAQSTPQVQDDVVQLDPAHTTIDFTLLGNLHTTHGRFTLKSGTIRIDPGTANATGEIAITTASEDSSEHLRDAIIQNAVLDIEHYPEIIFTPQRIQGIRDSQGHFYGQITGLMQLHGGLHQITVQIQGRLFADEVTADCNFLVPYVEWGVESPNVLSPTEIINSTRGSETGPVSGMFSIFAYMLPVLRHIPPHLFHVSDLVQVKVHTYGHVIWAPGLQARKMTIIVPSR
jgi:polyisoprenoid-binding protein YceI